tara:strand:- start:282 stop:428 length:147 start_codon:yes stop_codon:yes gene_type:complete
MLWKRSVGMYGGSGSIMIINIMFGLIMVVLVGLAIYGFYMAYWGVWDE